MKELLASLVAGDRRALARAITLVESTRHEDRASAHALLDHLPPSPDTSIIVGISGTPGVGKSSFVNAMGRHILEQGHRLAVLAVDPSSISTGGSILGDKTRMMDIARSPSSFIRPSPTAGVLGGVAAATRKAIRLCEAAGYGVVLVETVGVGQSEVSVEAMVDLFVLLIAPGGGDDVQGIKRGVMELVDMIVVNKDDGGRRDLARTTMHDYRSALHLFRPKHRAFAPSVLSCSTLEQRGVKEAWNHIKELHRQLADTETLGERRQDQRERALSSELAAGLTAIAERRTSATSDLLQADVRAGRRDPSSAAYEVLADLFNLPDAPARGS